VSITQAQAAIITVTFNSQDFIEDYLSSVTPFIRDTPHHLFIIDNASSDNTCKIVEQYSKNHQLDDKLHIIKLSENIGFGKGCNTGIEAARIYQPTHFWILNPDTQVYQGSGNELLQLLDTHKTIDFAGSILVNKKRIPRAGAFRFPGLVNVILSTLKLGILDRLLHQFTTAVPIAKQPYRADWLTGASFMAKADCIYQLNGFDPTYFLYFEEVDLFYRAKAAGFSVWACPASQVFHISGASTGINNHKKAIKRRPAYWFESRRHYYISNYGRTYFTAVDMAFIACHLLWKLRAAIQRKEDDTPPHFIRDILHHSYPMCLLARKK
jgi:GT2 family glycosyltransferase